MLAAGGEPVRPRPTWTSSKTSSIPRSSHSRRSPARNSPVAGYTPPSACTGSTNTAQVSSLTSFSTEARLLNSAKSMPGSSGSKPLWYLGWPVVEMDP